MFACLSACASRLYAQMRTRVYVCTGRVWYCTGLEYWAFVRVPWSVQRGQSVLRACLYTALQHCALALRAPWRARVCLSLRARANREGLCQPDTVLLYQANVSALYQPDIDPVSA